MNVRITFTDGTHEDRDRGTPVSDSDARGYPEDATWVKEAGCYGDSITDNGFYPALGDVLGEPVRIWVIIGQDRTTKALLGEWQNASVENEYECICRLTAERDKARAALQSLLDDCATWRAHRGATGMGAHLPHDLMSAPPSVVQYIERAAKQGLGQ